jgi:hypothetical protein
MYLKRKIEEKPSIFSEIQSTKEAYVKCPSKETVTPCHRLKAEASQKNSFDAHASSLYLGCFSNGEIICLHNNGRVSTPSRIQRKLEIVARDGCPGRRDEIFEFVSFD